MSVAAPNVGADTPPEVSVIIVNWNTADLLAGCLASIAAETRVAHEVIVVDNASTDGSAAMVRDNFPEVRLIANQRNAGFAAANNQGLAAARGRHVLLLNPDTVILDGAVDTMLAWLADHPEVGCVGCQVRETPERIQMTSFADPSAWTLFVVEAGLMRALPGLFGWPEYRGWDRTTAREVDVVSGMFMLVPRVVLDAVGPLDEAFFVYAEEADWCRRIRAAGWRCMFVPEARILHLDGGSKATAQIRPAMYVQKQKSHLIYIAKHDGRAGWLAAKAVLLGSMTLRLAVFGPLGRLRDGARVRARLAQTALAWHLLGREPAR